MKYAPENEKDRIISSEAQQWPILFSVRLPHYLGMGVKASQAKMEFSHCDSFLLNSNTHGFQ